MFRFEKFAVMAWQAGFCPSLAVCFICGYAPDKPYKP